MNTDQIREEYAKNGRLSGKAMTALKDMLRHAIDPYSAITLAGDTGAFQLAPEIVPHLNSDDSMIRWNAAGVLFTRFRDVRFAGLCLEMLERESDTIVRGVCLVGAGELLPLIEDQELKALLAKKLLDVMQAEDEFPEMRSAAYMGVEAAVGIPPTERAPADRLLNLEKDVKREVIDTFHKSYWGVVP